MTILIIYDNTGYIYIQISGTYRIPEGGINYLEVEIPQGKRISKVDTTLTPNFPVYEDIPQTEIEKVNTQMSTILEALIQ